MSRDIWVYIEHEQGRLANVSLELLGEAVRLKEKMVKPGQVAAVLIGSQVEHLAQEVLEYGVDKIYLAQNEKLSLYNPEYYGAIIARLVTKEDPHIFLLGATSIGTHLAPMVAAKVKTGVAAHCIELKLNSEDNLVAVVPAFGGKVLGDILCPKHRPQMATVKPGIFTKPEKNSKGGQIIKVDLNFLNEIKPRLKPLNLCREKPKGVPLEEAQIVVCGGWGIGDQEHWALLEKIAERLGGAVACTRPPVDEGWAPGEHIMIGTSGKSIRPQIYLGFGISGATHHICGMKDAGIIISVNRDENAEIFKVSDYGLVGDVKEILPLLESALQNR